MIVGNKVLIRSVEQEDLPHIYNWSNDFELKELFDFVVSFTSFEELANQFNSRLCEENIIDFTVVERETKMPVGRCMLTDIDYVNRKSLCSLYIGDSKSRDKGYGTEAMILLMKFAFEDLGLNRLGLWVFDYNKRAIKCYKRCGMKVEGILREGVYRNGKYHDMYLMGILRNEYDEIIKEVISGCSEASM